MDDLEVRELRYFVAVAEELNFGRAAERLGIAQPPLSRAIRRIEDRLGVTLFTRSTRHVALTPAGETLLGDARAALAAVSVAVRRVRRAGQPTPTLPFATKAGHGWLVTRLLDAYAREPDLPPAEVLVGGWAEPIAMLRDGRAEVALVDDSVDRRGIEWEPVRTERMAAALPVGHRLAGRARLWLADLAGETFPTWPAAHPSWNKLPPGAIAGPPVTDGAQLMESVALGQLIALLPADAARSARADLVFREVVDAPTAAFGVAWRDDSTSPAVAAFVRAATTVAADLADEGRAPVASVG